jgi:hypothetical protein
VAATAGAILVNMFPRRSTSRPVACGQEGVTEALT